MFRFPHLAFAALASAALAAPAVLCAQPALTEDFTSTTYRDAAHTTAQWSTADGELRPVPFTPLLAGSYDSPGDARGVAVAGDLVLLADGANGLVLVDFADPADPVPVGTYDTPGLALDVAVDGDLAAVADDAGILVLVDITDPSAPALLGMHATGDRARAVALAGDRAYVAGGAAGLEVVDVSDPTLPVALGAHDTPGFAAGLALAGNRAYVADGLGGLVIVDVTDPALPSLLGSYDSPGYANDVAIDGTTAFLADGATGLLPVDAADPTAPVPGAPFATAGSALGVALAGNLVCVAHGAGGLTVVDATDPGGLALAVAYDTAGYSYRVAVAAEHALLAEGTAGLTAVAFTSFVPPAQRGAYDVPGEDEHYAGVAVAGDLAVVADFIDGVVDVYDLSDPQQPVPLGAVAGAPAYAVEIDGVHAYLAAGTAGLEVVDLTDPALPTIVGTYDTQGTAVDVAVSGDFAYVADDGLGLQIVDISDPANPALSAFLFLAGEAQGVAVAGDRAYLAGGTAGLQVVDISNPHGPAAVATLATADVALAVAVEGDLAAVALSGADLAVELVDISNPGAPASICTFQYATGYSPRELAIAGNRLYTQDPWSIRVIDIAAPAQPALLATVWQSQSYNYLQGLTLCGEDLVAVEDRAGIRVLQAYQHRLASATGNVGQSLPLVAATDTIVRARLTGTPPGDVTWELNAAGDASWVPAADGAWVAFTDRGTGLRWRSTHDWVPAGQLTVEELTVEWLYARPVISAVTDIANDQGRQVHLEWRRSGHDFPGDATQITEYAVYRRIDPLKSAPAPPGDLAGASASVREHATALLAAGWHFLATVPVRVEDDYAVVVPTLADSTIADGQHFSTFMVTAMTATPGVFFDSSPDSGYSLDNLAPGVPAGITAAYAADGVVLDWLDAPEADFRSFRVYRGDDPGFLPGAGNLVAETVASAWADPAANPWNHHYRITAVDFSGNEGGAGAPAGVSGASDGGLPTVTALGRAVPNPFNPSTTLSFSLAAPGHARLRVHDAAGRLVATLVDEVRPAGGHAVTWDGRDASGRRVASGVYLYRLEAAGHRAVRKMVLLK